MRMTISRPKDLTIYIQIQLKKKKMPLLTKKETLSVIHRLQLQTQERSGINKEPEVSLV